MNKHSYKKHFMLIFILFLLVVSIPSSTGSTPLMEQQLPPPLLVEMFLEKTITWRMSVRNFTQTPLTDQELSTILWAAYGVRQDGNRTIPLYTAYATHIYVLTNESVYKYNPLNHSLIFHKTGDYRSIGQYQAPIQLGIVWDTQLSNDENLTGAQIGAIGQNIHFMATALNLGTVVTAGDASVLDVIDLPSHEKARVIMPLGHPTKPYNFILRPFLITSLPEVQCSGISLGTILNQTRQSTLFTGQPTEQDQSQLLWVSYGYSQYIDNSDQDKNPVKRHRTVPSAHGYYPLRIYMVTSSGVYRYTPGFYNPLYGLLRGIWILPVYSKLRRVNIGDHRMEVNQAIGDNFSVAPMYIIPVLDKRQTNRPYDDLSGDKYLWLWYYEAGAIAQNIFLESAAWNLTTNVVKPTNTETIQSALKLNDNFTPLLILPIGKQ